MAVVPPSVMERIRDRAEVAYPEECCGFLTGIREGGAVRVLEEIPAANAAAEEDRRREFLVEPEALLDVMKTYRDRDEDVVGFYHSHPDHQAELSPTDLKFARLWPRTVWLIVPVTGREKAEEAVAGRTGKPDGERERGNAGRERGNAGEERAWWLPGTEAGHAEMIIRSSADAARAVTPRGETA